MSSPCMRNQWSEREMEENTPQNKHMTVPYKGEKGTWTQGLFFNTHEQLEWNRYTLVTTLEANGGGGRRSEGVTFFLSFYSPNSLASCVLLISCQGLLVVGWVVFAWFWSLFSLPLVAWLLLAVVGAFNIFITSLLSPLLFYASLALPTVLFKMYSFFAVTFLSIMYSA